MTDEDLKVRIEIEKALLDIMVSCAQILNILRSWDRLRSQR